MIENFEKCLEMLLVHEGGFVNHPEDPGGMTNLGVTKQVYEDYVDRQVDEEEMRALTKKDVAPIYKKKYWDRCKCDHLKSGIDWAVFDWAVNSGTARPAKAIQKICGASPDGVIGPKTLHLLSTQNRKYVIEQLHDKRQSFYEGLSTFKTFGKGWTRRNKETKEKALEMI